MFGIIVYCLVLLYIIWYCRILFGIVVYYLVLSHIVWYCCILFGIVIYYLVLSHPVCLYIYRWQPQKEELPVLGIRQAAVTLGMLPLRANVALAW